MNNIPEGLRLARANAIVPAIQQPAGANAPAASGQRVLNALPQGLQLAFPGAIGGPVGGPVGGPLRIPPGASPRRGRKNNRKSRRNNTRKNRKNSRKNRRN